MDIIGVIIAGIIIGGLGKFFAPGDRDNIPLWLTIVCGVGGVLIGYYLAAALGVEATRGIDWTRWIISIIVAAVLVMIAASVTARRAAGRSNESWDREDQGLGADEAPPCSRRHASQGFDPAGRKHPSALSVPLLWLVSARRARSHAVHRQDVREARLLVELLAAATRPDPRRSGPTDLHGTP